MFFRAMVGRPFLDTWHRHQTRPGRHHQMVRSSGDRRDHRSLLGYGRSMFGRVGLCKYPGLHRGCLISSPLSETRPGALRLGRGGEDSWAGAAVDTRY